MMRGPKIPVVLSIVSITNYVLRLVLRSTWQKEIHDAMRFPSRRNRKTTMQALSIQQMRSVFVMYTHREAQARKQLVLHVSTLPMHLSHIGNCPRDCRLWKLPSKERNRPCNSSAMVNRFKTKQNPGQPSLAPVSSQLGISSLAVMVSTTFQQRNKQVYQKKKKILQVLCVSQM